MRKENAADAVTLGNALCGFLAMTYVADGRFTAAGLLIFLAILLDGLDGVVARRWGSTKGGRYADAFADAISFSLAPALFIYALTYDPLRGSAWVDPLNALAVVAATLVAAFGLIRLMRFAEVDFEVSQFRGLPTPANAMFLVSLGLLFGPPPWDLAAAAPLIVLAGALLSSALMVTVLPYPKVGDSFRTFAAAGSVVAVAITAPVILFGGDTACAFWTGCAMIELPLFAAGFGIMLAYIVGGPWYAHARPRSEVVPVQ